MGKRRILSDKHPVPFNHLQVHFRTKPGPPITLSIESVILRTWRGLLNTFAFLRRCTGTFAKLPKGQQSSKRGMRTFRFLFDSSLTALKLVQLNCPSPGTWLMRKTSPLNSPVAKGGGQTHTHTHCIQLVVFDRQPFGRQ